MECQKFGCMENITDFLFSLMCRNKIRTRIPSKHLPRKFIEFLAILTRLVWRVFFITSHNTRPVSFSMLGVVFFLGAPAVLTGLTLGATYPDKYRLHNM